MPSTACSCIADLRDGELDVLLIDPTCRVHAPTIVVPTRAG